MVNGQKPPQGRSASRWRMNADVGHTRWLVSLLKNNPCAYLQSHPPRLQLIHPPSICSTRSSLSSDLFLRDAPIQPRDTSRACSGISSRHIQSTLSKTLRRHHGQMPEPPQPVPLGLITVNHFCCLCPYSFHHDPQVVTTSEGRNLDWPVNEWHSYSLFTTTGRYSILITVDATSTLLQDPELLEQLHPFPAEKRGLKLPWWMEAISRWSQQKHIGTRSWTRFLKILSIKTLSSIKVDGWRVWSEPSSSN